ncbi:ABC transporter ATP-binding protein|uniref:ABC transporter transmembrane region n=1 Tax=Dendrosporobacter quercicolus TaxID=146817 RepID=A0A1G9NHQ2_9FIRM|nr:ABC transporter ATP-binding protein [Dendrosporobacter quercicolus]NSL47340.1 ABC transporter ATP-binding protein [Dendrosporobacter quercicolus DSM 1736]SDL85891.1 ABC transporter transmembrane region [Dendrosporobacter quercicolus]
MNSPYFRLAGFALSIKKELSLKILLLLMIVAFSILQAFMLAYGTAGVFSGAAPSTIFFYYAIATVCILIRAVLTGKQEVYTKKIAGRAKAVLRSQLVNKLIDLGPKYQSLKRSGRLQSLVTDGVEYAEPYLVNYLPQAVVVVISSLCIGGYIFSFDWKVGVILMIAVVIAVVTPLLLMPFIKKAALEYWQGYAVLNAQYIDAMQGMNTLKALNAVDRKGHELYLSAECFRKRQLHWTFFSLISSATIFLMLAVGKYLTVGVATFDMAAGILNRPELLVILFLVIECMRPISDLDQAWHASYMGLSVAHEIFEILDEPVTIVDAPQAQTGGMDEGFPRIAFKNVSFRYPARTEYALKNVSFTIEPGQSVAIVGKSGGGKSTITNLLLRFYDVEEGSITINGTDLRDYSLEYLRSKIAIVFQDTYLFYGTVAENIGMAAEHAREEEIIDAAKMANAHPFIIRMKNGYQTLVGERGATLSGGEKQRIAIARAILKNAPVLILDEATSSVDAANEHMIQSTIGKLAQRYTSLIVAHRLSTIRNVERIFVFDQGVLKEYGSHDELIAKNGAYKQLLEAQAIMEEE